MEKEGLHHSKDADEDDDTKPVLPFGVPKPFYESDKPKQKSETVQPSHTAPLEGIISWTRGGEGLVHHPLGEASRPPEAKQPDSGESEADDDEDDDEEEATGYQPIVDAEEAHSGEEPPLRPEDSAASIDSEAPEARATVPGEYRDDLPPLEQATPDNFHHQLDELPPINNRDESIPLDKLEAQDESVQRGPVSPVSRDYPYPHAAVYNWPVAAPAPRVFEQGYGSVGADIPASDMTPRVPIEQHQEYNPNTDPRVGPLAVLLGLEYFARKRADRKVEGRLEKRMDEQLKQVYATIPEPPIGKGFPERRMPEENTPPDAQAEQPAPILLKDSQHVERSAWHNIVVDEHGHEVAGAINYGEGFKREQHQELRRNDQLPDVPTAAPVYIPQMPVDQYGRPVQSGGLPSGMTNPTLPQGMPMPVDPQHQLPASSKQIGSGVDTIWVWIVFLLILAAIFTAIFA